MEILDSGKRRNFESGAVRDINDEEKGRCDLLPLSVAANLMNDIILSYLDDYVRKGEPMYLILAIKWFVGNEMKERMETAMLEVSKHYQGGCKKYGDRNWEKGIPIHSFIDSGIRHYLKHLRGDTDEPHALAFLWNLMCAHWTHENKPHLRDLPFNSALAVDFRLSP